MYKRQLIDGTAVDGRTAHFHISRHTNTHTKIVGPGTSQIHTVCLNVTGSFYVDYFSINTMNIFFLPNYFNNIFFSLVYFIVRIQYLLYMCVCICIYIIQNMC